MIRSAVAYVPHAEPPDFTAEGMFSECRRRADLLKEGFDAHGSVGHVFAAGNDLGEAAVATDFVPPDLDSGQEAFVVRVVSSVLGMLKAMGGGEPMRTLTVLNMKSQGRKSFSKGPDGKFSERAPDPSRFVDLVVLTVCQKGQKRGAVIVFEDKMFLCEKGMIKNRLVVPTVESMPHADTVVPGIFDRMVLDGKAFAEAQEGMMADIEAEIAKNSVGRDP